MQRYLCVDERLIYAYISFNSKAFIPIKILTIDGGKYRNPVFTDCLCFALTPQNQNWLSVICYPTQNVVIILSSSQY